MSNSAAGSEQSFLMRMHVPPLIHCRLHWNSGVVIGGAGVGVVMVVVVVVVVVVDVVVVVVVVVGLHYTDHAQVG